MKITLNEKLFEAKGKKNKPESATVPTDQNSSEETKIEKDVPVPKDSRSDYMKKLILLFKKSGMVEINDYDRNKDVGSETLNFSTRNDSKNYELILSSKKFRDENNEVVKEVNQYRFYKIIDGNRSPATTEFSLGKFKKVDSFETFVEEVVGYTNNKELDNPNLITKLIPEVENEVNKESEAKPETSEDRPLSELPATPEDGKPLPKEITNPPTESSDSSEANLGDLYTDFIEQLQSDKKFTIKQQFPKDHKVFYLKSDKPNEQHSATFLNKNGKIFAQYGTRGNMSNTEIEDDDLSELVSSVGISNKTSSETPKAVPQVVSKKDEPIAPIRRMAPTATSNVSKPVVSAPSLSRDEMKQGVSDASKTTIPTPKPKPDVPERPETEREKTLSNLLKDLTNKGFKNQEVMERAEVTKNKNKSVTTKYKDRAKIESKDGKQFIVNVEPENKVRVVDPVTGKTENISYKDVADLSNKISSLSGGTAPINQPIPSNPTVTPTKSADRVRGSQGNASSDVQAPIISKQAAKPKIASAPAAPKPTIQPEKPVASAVNDADISTKPEEQKSIEPVSEPSVTVSQPELSAKQPYKKPSLKTSEPEIPQEVVPNEPSEEQTPEEIPQEQPDIEPEISPQNTFKHPDYKDEISGKDPYSTDRVKQNKQKLQTLNDTEFNIVVSKPFSLGKKSQTEDSGELYSRTVNVDTKGNVRYVFNLKFPEANKKLFEAVEKTNLQTTITKIINSFKNLKTKEIAITDFQNAELDGLYIPKNILASVLVTTSKNVAKAPVAQIPLNPSDKQIKDISLNVAQKISEIIANDVSMEDSITKISFITTLSKSDRQPEEDLSGGTNIGRKVKPPQIPPINEPVTQVQQDPSYKIDPNNTGVQKMAKQLGISGGDTVPNAQQGIPESEVYKNKAVFELYNPMVSEGPITTDQISSSPSFKLRDMKYRGLVNNAFYLESSNSLVFNLMPSQEKGFSVVSSPDSAFVFEASNGEKKFFSAEKGFKILGKNDKKELVPVSDFRKAGELFYVVLGNLPVIQEASFDPAAADQETNKEKIVDKTLQSIPQQNQGPATAVGKQKAIQPDTSPISTDPTQVAQIPTQQPSKPSVQNSKPNALSNLEAIRHFRKAILGHVRSNLPAFSEAFPKKSETLIKWLKDSQILPSGNPSTPEPQKVEEPSKQKEPEVGEPKKRGRPKKITEARKDNNWERPSHQNWQNPNDEPLSVRSTNLRKQDYFGPGQNRRLEKDTVMYATKESDIIDGINDVFKGFTDKSLTRPIDLQPYLQKLESRKFFPIKVVKLENNMFFVKSDSSDKLFIIAPVGILYERIKHFYQTPASTNDSRVMRYTKLASIPLERANVSMAVVENQITKGVCIVNAANYTK